MIKLPARALLLLALASAGCSLPQEADEPVGTAEVAITNVPSDVACIVLTATGSRTVTRSYDVVAGASSVLPLSGLPVGTVSFKGDAYAGACATVTSSTTPNWIAEPVSGTVASSGVASIELMMRRNGKASVAVDWEGSAASHALTIVPSGSGAGLVTSSAAGINCGSDCTETYAAGTVVTLTAAPSAGSVFSGWSGGGCSGTGTCSVTMTAATSVTATFTSTFALTVTRAGAGGGVVVSDVAGINCGTDCTESYLTGTTVMLTATPAPGNTFTGWSGACLGTTMCIVNMNAAKFVTATFAVATHTVTVNRVGSGSGTVTSSPAGINCGTSCYASFTQGTTVVLTATPASGSFFAGWSGCPSSTGTTCTITNLLFSTLITATFN